MTSRLLLLEDRSQIDVAARGGLLTTDAKVLALSPEVMYSLDRRGRSYSIPEDYYSDAEWNAICSDNFPGTIGLCRLLDGFVRRSGPLAELSEPSPSLSSIYFLKMLIDAVQTRAFALRRVLTAEQPGVVSYFPNRRRPIEPNLMFVDESVYSELAPLVARTVGAASEPLGGAPARRSHPVPQRLRLRAGVRSLVKGLGLRKLRHLQGMGLWREALRRRADDCPSVLVMSSGLSSVDISRVVQKLTATGGFRLMFWDGDDDPMVLVPLRFRDQRVSPEGDLLSALREAMRRAWTSQICDSPELRNRFVFSGVDCWPVVSSRLEFFVTQVVPDYAATYRRSVEVFRRHATRLVLTGAVTYHRHGAIAAAARKLGIPVVTYQHGGAYGYVDYLVHIYTDLGVSDYFLAYGSGVAADLGGGGDVYSLPQARVVSVGSPALNELAARPRRNTRAALQRKWHLSPDKCTFLYPPIPFLRNSRYGPYCCYPDDVSYRLQAQIVDLIGSLPQAQLVVKTAYGRSGSWNPLPRYVEDHGYQNVLVTDNGWFAEWLPVADALIIDWPSTILLQALTTAKPVFLFIDRQSIRLRARAEALLRDEVVFTDDWGKFSEVIQQFVRGEIGSERHRAKSRFLELYGTGPYGDRCAEVACEFLTSVMNGSSSDGVR